MNDTAARIYCTSLRQGPKALAEVLIDRATRREQITERTR